MGIKIKVSDRVRFKVAGTLNDEAGKAVPFEFSLTAKRLPSETVQTMLGELKFDEFARQVVLDWSDVVEVADGGDPQAGINELLAIGGMAQQITRTYLTESGAKEKN